MRGRLNLFQVAMLRWRELHPYNAVHVVRVAKPLDGAALQQAIDGVLAESGLTGLALDAGHRRYEWAGGPARSPVGVVPLAPGADPARAVDAEIERQLNARFPRAGAIDAFRFFAFDYGGTFDLGLSYDHFIAAGDSIVALLKTIVERYAGAVGGRTAAPRAPAIDRYPPTYGHLFRRQLAAAILGLRRIPAIADSFRRAFRPRYPHGGGPHNAFTHVRVEPAGVEALRRTAKAWGVTVNDLVLALLLQALAPFTEARRAEPRRNRLAVASIVNIRGDCGTGARFAFGQFLSSFLVTHAVPPGIALEALARDVHAETARVKAGKLYLQTLVAMAAGGLIARAVAPRDRARFYRKSYPVWGGMTSLNVEALWAEAGGHGKPQAYLRAASTGPQAPLVAVMTGSAGGLDVGLSFRTVAFTRLDVDKMVADFVDCIDRLP